MFAVAAVAFPVLYSAHAKESHRIVVVQYGVSEVSKKPAAPSSANNTSPQYYTVAAAVHAAGSHKEKQAQQDHKPTTKKSTATPAPKPDTQEVLVAQKEEAKQTYTKTEEPTPPEITPKIGNATFFETLRAEIHRRTNQERAKVGLEPLVYDQRLARIALGHSSDMQTKGYLDHVSPSGCDVTCRVERAGYDARMWGENIIWIEATTLPEVHELAQSFMESWMNSGGHRKNILTEGYTHQGIGIVRDGGVVHVTVNFAQPL